MIGLNRVKTWILIAAMGGLFVLIGGVIGGQNGMIVALAIALIFNFSMYWFSAKIAIATTRSKPVTEQEYPDLYRIVRELTQTNQMPMPSIYVSDIAQPNAFATGRNPQNSAVAATTGLLQMLTYDELAGVMAHELAHIRNRDTLIMTVSATIAGAISTLAQFGFLFGGRGTDRPNPIVMIGTAILAPLAAMIIQMAVSRSREYDADRGGAEICGNPLWLASALAKLEAGAAHIPNPEAERHPATAHMFIVTPLTGHGMDNLFSTHPATEKRIAALQELAGVLGSGASPARPRGGFLGAASSSPWGGVRARRGPWG